MSRSRDAYAELQEALEKWQPECLGSDLYTADEFSRPDIDAMRTVCNTCPVFAECFDYAATARPLAGYWAGHTYSYYRNAKGLVA